jgi:DICT domain-containing protein
MDWITYTTASGSQTVTNTMLYNMTFVEDAFFVESDQSTLNIQDVTIEKNQAITTQWNSIVVRDRATATVSKLSINDNNNLRFGIISFNAAITVSDSTIRQNKGVVSYS